MRYLVGLVLVLALGVVGCSETSGTGGSAGGGGSSGGGSGGSGWFRQDIGPTNPLFAASFTDANTGTIVGLGTILRTEDGGETWVEQAPGFLVGFERFVDVELTRRARDHQRHAPVPAPPPPLGRHHRPVLEHIGLPRLVRDEAPSFARAVVME